MQQPLFLLWRFTPSVICGDSSLKGEHALSGAPAPDSPFCRCVTSFPGAGEVFPQRESQAVTLVAKVLSIMRKFPAVLLALPLGELSLQVTERAHAVSHF